MYSYFDYSNEQDIQALVHQFEEMSLNGTVGFFETSSFLRLLDYYESEFNLEKAHDVIQHALVQHPYSAALYIRKAALLFESDRPDAALECLYEAEMYDASELELYMLRAEILTWKKQYDAALDALEIAMFHASKSDKYDVFISIANVYEDMDKFDKVFGYLRKALLMNPKGEEALDKIWLAVELSEHYDESIKLHNQILDIDAYSYMAWYNLGHAHLCKQEYEQAIEAFEFAFVIKEDFEFAYRDCGEAYFELKDYESAIKTYKKALEHIRPDSSIYLHIGQCFEELDDYASAREHYLKAAKLNGQNPDVFHRLGECYSKEERWISAVSSFKKAIKLNGENSKYVAGLAEAYYQLDKNSEADVLFRKALILDLTNNEIWVQYVSFLIDIEEYEEAYQMLEEADKHCASIELLYCKVACLFYWGQRKEAANLLLFALEEDFEMHTSLFELFPDLENEPEILAVITGFER